MGDRVAVLSPEGQFGTVDSADAEAVTRAGGKVLTKGEVAARELDEAYAKKSTLEKAAGFVTPALPAPVQMALRGAGVAPLPPELEAYRAGASQAFSAGLEGAITKEGVDLVAGKEAAHAFGQTQADLKEAHSGLYSAGEVAGFIGGAIAGGPKAGLGSAAKLIPGVGIGAVGGIAERSAAQVLAPVAARGAIGRALATAGEFAARGAAEGALYSGASQITEDMLGDHEIAADKVFAAMGTGALYGGGGGALLGGAGSLAASGVRATTGAVRSGIGRALSRGSELATDASAKVEGAAADVAAKADQAVIEARGAAADAKAAVKGAVDEATVKAHNAAVDAVKDAKASLEGIADATGTKLPQEEGALKSLSERYGSKDVQKGWAQDQAWKAIGAGNGLQSTGFAKSAERYLPNGTKDVGEVILRKGIINVDDGIINAARYGTPDAMLPKIQAAREAVGQEIGSITAASPAQVHGLDIGKAINDVAAKYEESAATKAVGKSLRKYGLDLHESLGLEARDTVPIQDLLRERQALDLMVFENAALDPSLTVQVKRELRSKLEGLVVKGLDEASGDVPGALRDKYKALKHDYTALSIAADAAEDSAARSAKAATFGLTDTLRGGGSIVKTVGSKLVRERGNAAAAVLLSRMADMGTITRAVRAVDEQIGRAAKGILAAPSARPLPEPTSTVPLRTRAQAIMSRVAEAQANPERVADSIARTVDPMRPNAPNIASSLTQRMGTALALIAAKMPVSEDKDPFDTHPAPRLSDAQAATIVRYGNYLERPMRFFEEVEHGKITHEGVEVARILMPGAFAELQQRTAEGLAELMAQGKKPPFAQRERLGVLLDFPATPSQRPDHMRTLQLNVLASQQDAKHGPQGAQAPKRPLPTKTQPSTLDRLEGR